MQIKIPTPDAPPELANVTLLLIDGVGNSLDGAKALLHCHSLMKFGETKYIGVNDLLKEIKEESHHIDYTFQQVDKMTWGDYGEFAIRELHKFIDTEFVLTINDDGFILNPFLWDEEYLQYDFIGAPWRKDYHFSSKPLGVSEEGFKVARNRNLVGNGGFSLRSKKFLEVSARCPAKFDKDITPEDVYVCLNNYHYFIESGIKYAPLELANKFSDNWQVQSAKQFGFHGNRNMIKIIEPHIQGLK